MQGFLAGFVAFLAGIRQLVGQGVSGARGGAMGHMRSLRCFHSGLQRVPYFGEEAERNAGLRLGTGVWGEPTNPSGSSQPVSLPRRGLQEPGSAPCSGLSPPVIRISPHSRQVPAMAKGWKGSGQPFRHRWDGWGTKMSAAMERRGREGKAPGNARGPGRTSPHGETPKRRGEDRTRAGAAPAPQHTEMSLKKHTYIALCAHPLFFLKH